MRALDGDRGAVTVEAALALCSLVAVMVMVIAAVSAASAHLRCVDAARETARLVSRGEPQRAREIAAAVAPRGAAVDVRIAGDEVHVRVTSAVVPGIPGLSLVGVAVGVMEPPALLSAEGPAGTDLPPADTDSPVRATTPDVPDTPESPTNSDVPDTPHSPTNSDVPDTPENPTNPDAPDVPP